MELRIKRLDPNLPTPDYARAGDAGLDLRSSIDFTLAPGSRARIPTGIAVEIPLGFAGLVVPRSGLADRHGIGLVNSPGLIDSGYRGEIQVLVVNLDASETFEMSRGDRIAQLMIVPVERGHVVEVSDLTATDRGDGGFGSTGRQ